MPRPARFSESMKMMQLHGHSHGNLLRDLSLKFVLVPVRIVTENESNVQDHSEPLYRYSRAANSVFKPHATVTPMMSQHDHCHSSDPHWHILLTWSLGLTHSGVNTSDEAQTLLSSLCHISLTWRQGTDYPRNELARGPSRSHILKISRKPEPLKHVSVRVHGPTSCQKFVQP
jgi:hypothetical protein